MPSKARYTWKKEPDERGLASVCQGERGWDLRLGGEHRIAVRPHRRGWYWYGMEHNTLNRTNWQWASAEEAKADALKFAKEHEDAK